MGHRAHRGFEVQAARKVPTKRAYPALKVVKVPSVNLVQAHQVSQANEV